MRQPYVITCPNCGRRFGAAGWQSTFTCPGCQAAFDVPEEASYRPALQSRAVRTAAVIILVTVILLLLVAVVMVITL